MRERKKDEYRFEDACRQPLISYPRFKNKLILSGPGISLKPSPTIPLPDNFKNKAKRKGGGNAVDFVAFHYQKICEIWYEEKLYTPSDLPEEALGRVKDWIVIWKSIWSERSKEQKVKDKRIAIILEDQAGVFAVIDAKHGKTVSKKEFIKLREDAEILRADESYLIVQTSTMKKIDGFNAELINVFPLKGNEEEKAYLYKITWDT